MPGGKVEVGGIVDDDEAKLDVGVWRYRYMVSEDVRRGRADLGSARVRDQLYHYQGADALLPGLRNGKRGFSEGNLADTTFATAYSPWTVDI